MHGGELREGYSPHSMPIVFGKRLRQQASRRGVVGPPRWVRDVLATSAVYRLRDLPGVASGLRHLARMPIEGRATLTHPAWQSSRTRISSLHDRGRHWTDQREQLAKQVSDVIWRMELEPIRRTIAVFGKSTFRVLKREYRRAIAELNSFCRSSPPKTYRERIQLLDELILAQEARRCLAEEANFAEAVLGDLWAGENSAWPKIQGLIEWVEQCDGALAGLDLLRSEVIAANVPWDTLAAEIESSAAELRWPSTASCRLPP